MIKVLLMMMLTAGLYAGSVAKKPMSEFDVLLKEYDNFSTDQVNTMHLVYMYGEERNLKWSLTAMSWEESKFGLFKVPVSNSGDYGLVKINIYWFLKRNKINDTIWNRSKFGTKLVTDDLYNLEEAVRVLRMGERTRKSWESYKVVWSYYNSGDRDALGMRYAERIALKVRVLKHIFKHRLEKL